MPYQPSCGGSSSANVFATDRGAVTRCECGCFQVTFGMIGLTVERAALSELRQALDALVPSPTVLTCPGRIHLGLAATGVSLLLSIEELEELHRLVSGADLLAPV